MPHTTPTSVIVTRPMPAAQTWQHALAPLLPSTLSIHSLPLIDIAALDEASTSAQLQQLLNNSAQFYAIAFVSRFAVEYFFAQPQVNSKLFSNIRAWAVGQGTREALLQAGIAPECIDTPPADAQQFDSNALWEQIAPQLQQPQAHGKTIFLVRGVDNTSLPPHAQKNNRLAHILQAHNIAHTSAFVYARKCPVWNANQQNFAIELLQKSNVWLFSSSMAVAHLAHLLPQISRTQWGAQHAVATHARIAQAAATLGFVHIQTIRPILDDVVQSILRLCKTKSTP